MNLEMAYLLGMIVGNGEIQQHQDMTTVVIDIPYKNLYTDDLKDVAIYVKASIVDIRSIIEPLVGNTLYVTETKHSTKMSFTKPNTEYVIREILRFIGGGRHHTTMKMHDDLFNISIDEKKAFLRGFADVTGHIRKSNIAFSLPGQHRVYLEIPKNWDTVIDVAKLLRDVDIPVQTIDFGHPNFRDSKCKKYNEGKTEYWAKEHQIKIWANEFVPVGFNIKHKQEALEKYAEEQLEYMDPKTTHKFYWEKTLRKQNKPIRPAENSPLLPASIRGKHFNSWTELAKELGYVK